MEISSRDKNRTKTKYFIKNTNLFFCFCGSKQNSVSQLESQQKLRTINFKSYKIYNKISTKVFENSIYKNTTPVINSITFFIQLTTPKGLLTKKILLNIKSFFLLITKLNNNIYSQPQIKQLKSFNYKTNKLLLYQFILTNLKSKFFEIM